MTDHIDTQVLETLIDVMEAEYPLLLDTFLADSEERVGLLKAACLNGVAEDLRQAAHSFKGSCSNMGALHLAELCRELEDLARLEQLAGAPELINCIADEFAIVNRLYRAEHQRFCDQTTR